MKNTKSSDNLAYWNSLGSHKEFKNPNLLLSNLTFLKKDVPILDIGCGYGRTLGELNQNGFSNLYGIDYSGEMISRAKKELEPNVDLRIGSATSLPYDNDSFLVVQLYAVLNCIPNLEEELKAIEEAIRVLGKGGYLLINDFPLTEPLDRYELQTDDYGELGYLKVDNMCKMRHTSVERIKNMVHSCYLISESISNELSMNGNPMGISSHIFRLK